MTIMKRFFLDFFYLIIKYRLLQLHMKDDICERTTTTTSCHCYKTSYTSLAKIWTVVMLNNK